MNKTVTVEKYGNQITVVIHPSHKAAVAHAIDLATENSSVSEEEAAESIKMQDLVEEGEWAVHVVEATDLSATEEDAW